MGLRRFLITLYFCVCISSPSLYSLEQEKLEFADVATIMNQIFDQHVVHKEMTEEVLKSSFVNYLDQFDPDRIYLLSSEVQTFLHPSPKRLKQLLSQYKRGNLSIFSAMNGVIQRAIERSRRWRSQIERKKQREEIFERANTSQDMYSSFEYHVWPASAMDIRNRIQEHFGQFIQTQFARYGVEKVLSKQQEVTSLYESELRSKENDYLFRDHAGKPMSSKKKEHYYVLNIIKALAKSLDAHTSFLNLNEAFDMKMRLEKGYVGIGVDFDQGIDGIIISGLTPDGPADREGSIRINDILVALDGQSVVGRSFDEVMALLSGKDGSQLILSIKRSDDDSLITVKLIREQILLEGERVIVNKSPFRDGIIGKITLNSFYQNPSGGVSSERDIRMAIDQLKREGPLYGLVLDLRGNSGGYLMQAVKVAGLFITNGVVVISKYGNGNVRYYRDLDATVAFDGPLIVLTSRLTASAAEIVAQALQDYGVAVIVGDDRTYGKGSIQSQTVTTGGQSSFFKVTVGQYYTVSGKTPETYGVLADIVVPGENMFGPLDAIPNSNPKIRASFADRLVDVHPDIRGWYLRYYIPTLQEQETAWQKFLPTLRRQSAERFKKIDTAKSEVDAQMEEAVFIAKDMVELEEASIAERFGR